MPLARGSWLGLPAVGNYSASSALSSVRRGLPGGRSRLSSVFAQAWTIPKMEHPDRAPSAPVDSPDAQNLQGRWPPSSLPTTPTPHDPPPPGGNLYMPFCAAEVPPHRHDVERRAAHERRAVLVPWRLRPRVLPSKPRVVGRGEAPITCIGAAVGGCAIVRRDVINNS